METYRFNGPSKRWRKRREISHSASARPVNASWPDASHSTEPDSSGEITPATTAPSRVLANDWHEATVPRICGNRSSASKVAPGPTSDMPKV